MTTTRSGAPTRRRRRARRRRRKRRRGRPRPRPRGNRATARPRSSNRSFTARTAVRQLPARVVRRPRAPRSPSRRESTASEAKAKAAADAAAAAKPPPPRRMPPTPCVASVSVSNAIRRRFSARSERRRAIATLRDAERDERFSSLARRDRRTRRTRRSSQTRSRAPRPRIQARRASHAHEEGTRGDRGCARAARGGDGRGQGARREAKHAEDRLRARVADLEAEVAELRGEKRRLEQQLTGASGARDERERREREARERKRARRNGSGKRGRDREEGRGSGKRNAIARRRPTSPRVRRGVFPPCATRRRARARHLPRRTGSSRATTRSERRTRTVGQSGASPTAGGWSASPTGRSRTWSPPRTDPSRRCTHQRGREADAPGGAGGVLLPGGGHVAHDAPGRDGGVSLSERTDGGARTQRVQGDPVPGRTAPSRVSGREGGGRARALRRTRGRTSRTRSARTWEYISHIRERTFGDEALFVKVTWRARSRLRRDIGFWTDWARARAPVPAARTAHRRAPSCRLRSRSVRTRALLFFPQPPPRVARSAVGSAAAALASRCGDGGARRRRARVACPARPLSEAETTALRDEAISWAAQHGLLVATASSDAGATTPAAFTHAPVALLPHPLPSRRLRARPPRLSLTSPPSATP